MLNTHAMKIFEIYNTDENIGPAPTVPVAGQQRIYLRHGYRHASHRASENVPVIEVRRSAARQ